ncbi:unnamed protein product [Echinostoma caproni]|uniref:t-SNARE coiled-coil homology domain-containing protein n=1 Tax=Echinostoma caproni TaxID=27848 RepID=A0A183AEK1_9TREM|nr:unnamed protein product [Echinostoma caproni]
MTIVSETLDFGGEQLVQRIEGSNDLIQKVSNQVYQARTGVSQIPDLRKEVRLLESVMFKWQEANQTSRKLENRMSETVSDLKSVMDRLRQMNNQLRDVLNERHTQAKVVQQPFIDLQNLVDRVSKARSVGWHALDEAQKKLARLEGAIVFISIVAGVCPNWLLLQLDFEDYVARTKALVPDTMSAREDLEKRLADIQANVKDLHNQAKQELVRAYDLSNRTDELQQVLEDLKSSVGGDQFDVLRMRIRCM